MTTWGLIKAYILAKVLFSILSFFGGIALLVIVFVIWAYLDK